MGKEKKTAGTRLVWSRTDTKALLALLVELKKNGFDPNDTILGCKRVVHDLIITKLKEMHVNEHWLDDIAKPR